MRNEERCALAIQRILPSLKEGMNLALTHRTRGSSIDHMVRHDGQPSTTVTRNPDGTISIETELTRPHNLPHLSVHVDVNYFDHWMQQAKTELEKLPKTRQPTPRDMQRTAHHAARDAACQAMAMDCEHSHFEAFNDAINSILDTETMLRADSLGAEMMGPSSEHAMSSREPWYCSVNQYNAILLSEHVIRQTLEQNPAIAQIWWALVLQLREEVPIPRSTDELGAILRSQMRLPRAAWKALLEARSCGDIPYDAGHPEYERCDSAREYLDRTAAACRALSGANLHAICEDMAGTIIDQGELSHWFETAHWDHGDPRTAWSHVIRQGALHHQPNCGGPTDPHDPYSDEGDEGDECFEQGWDIRTVGHTLRKTVGEQQPWTQAGWRRYWERTGKLPRPSRRDLQLLDLSWNTDLPEFTTRDSLTVTPMTESAQLRELAVLMNNCLDDYTAQCASGRTIIVTVRRQEELLAAGEILKKRTTWRTGEVRAAENEPAPRGATMAVREAARRLTAHLRATISQ